MAYATLDGVPVSSGLVVLPRYGRGHATVTLATAGEPVREGDSVTLTLDGRQSFRLTVTAAGKRRGAWQVRAVLGANKLAQVVPAKFYQNIPRQTVVRDILNAAGESIAGVDVSGTLERFVRRRQPAHAALNVALAGTGCLWRVQPDGGVLVQAKAPPAYAGVGRVVQEQPARKAYGLLPLPDLLPGVTLTLSNGLTVVLERVVQHIGPRLITEVQHE